MVMNNKTMWKHAEMLAKFINEAYTNIKKNEAKWQGEIADENIKELKGKCTKKRFIHICTNFSMFVHTDVQFYIIVEDVMSLQKESIADDPEISYEMFIACFKFHLALYEREWKEKDNIDENK